jgi:hypothetical protein
MLPMRDATRSDRGGVFFFNPIHQFTQTRTKDLERVSEPSLVSLFLRLGLGVHVISCHFVDHCFTDIDDLRIHTNTHESCGEFLSLRWFLYS